MGLSSSAPRTYDTIEQSNPYIRNVLLHVTDGSTGTKLHVIILCPLLVELLCTQRLRRTS